MERPVKAALLLLISLAAFGCDREVAGGKADGPAIFAEACSRCHGDKGVPPKALVAQMGAKNLTDPALQTRLSDADIAHQVRHGSANKMMPAFSKAIISDAQLKALIAHVRALRRAP